MKKMIERFSYSTTAAAAVVILASESRTKNVVVQFRATAEIAQTHYY